MRTDPIAEGSEICWVCKDYAHTGFIVHEGAIIPCFRCNRDNKNGLQVPTAAVIKLPANMYGRSGE
jgi:hypothetical protein